MACIRTTTFCVVFVVLCAALSQIEARACETQDDFFNSTVATGILASTLIMCVETIVLASLVAKATTNVHRVKFVVAMMNSLLVSVQDPAVVNHVGGAVVA